MPSDDDDIIIGSGVHLNSVNPPPSPLPPTILDMKAIRNQLNNIGSYVSAHGNDTATMTALTAAWNDVDDAIDRAKAMEVP